MSALLRYGLLMGLPFLLGGYLAWDHQAGNISDLQADHAKLERGRAEAASRAESDQRVIEFNRQEAINNEFAKFRTALAAADVAGRDRAAALTGVRNALAAATARSGQASGDPGPLTGADDPATLRRVVAECTAEYGKMVGNAVGAGIAVSGLQGYVEAVRINSPPSHSRSPEILAEPQ